MKAAACIVGALVVCSRLGEAQGAERLYVPADGEIVVNVKLKRAAAELTEVVIEGKKVWVPPRLGGVYERASRGWGKLFTEDDIRQQNPSDLKALLNTVPTVHTNESSGKVQVYVDGLRLSDDLEDADKVLKGIHPSSVAAMEVFTGVARLPGEFHSDACAAIAIWTKSY